MIKTLNEKAAKAKEGNTVWVIEWETPGGNLYLAPESYPDEYHFTLEFNRAEWFESKEEAEEKRQLLPMGGKAARRAVRRTPSGANRTDRFW